jgi:hypothetical protein
VECRDPEEVVLLNFLLNFDDYDGRITPVRGKLGFRGVSVRPFEFDGLRVDGREIVMPGSHCRPGITRESNS